MADKSLSSPQPQGSTGDIVAESTARRKPVTNHLLSCTNCRKRKVKCNKLSPCSACERSCLSCVFPNRARLPRGRTGGSKATNNELLRRLSKLEELLENAQKNENNEPIKPATTYNSRGTSGSTPNIESGAADGAASQHVTNEALDKYIGTNFWKSLIHEVGGHRFSQFVNQNLIDLCR